MQYYKIDLLKEFPFLSEYNSTGYIEVYLPDIMYEFMRKDNRRPGIILCPGSAYLKRCERECEPVAIKLMEMGFNVFVLQYSVSPSKHPVHLLEMASLFNLLNNNQEKFNIDVNKIGVMGFSAGGHICALYSNLYQCEEIKKHFKKVYKPYVTILAYPVISAEKDIWHEKSIVNFLGHTPSEEEINSISAEKLVSEDTPPTFIWHTAGDTMVSPLNSIKYAEALMKHNISNYLIIYPFGNHGMITADRETISEISKKENLIADWINQLKKWIDLTFFEK